MTTPKPSVDYDGILDETPAVRKKINAPRVILIICVLVSGAILIGMFVLDSIPKPVVFW